MSIASRFLTRPDTGPTVTLTVDGETITARAGETLAAALLAHSGSATRTTQTGAERAAYCMMGVCFDCVVEVDGQPNTQACMVQVRDGMEVRRQQGLRGVSDV